jgi:hypothetical protein
VDIIMQTNTIITTIASTIMTMARITTTTTRKEMGIIMSRGLANMSDLALWRR